MTGDLDRMIKIQRVRHAMILFDAMDQERKNRVWHACLACPSETSLRDAFLQAVEAEATEIEREMLLVQPAEGKA